MAEPTNPTPEEKPNDPLADAFLEGLRQDSADPDAADERFMNQAAALEPEDFSTEATEFGPEDEDEEDEEEDDDSDY